MQNESYEHVGPEIVLTRVEEGHRQRPRRPSYRDYARGALGIIGPAPKSAVPTIELAIEKKVFPA
jgi:hypothetical protein